MILLGCQVQEGTSDDGRSCVHILRTRSDFWTIVPEHHSERWAASLHVVTTTTLPNKLPMPPPDLVLPSLAETPSPQRPELCRRKIGLCCLIASYADPDSDKASYVWFGDEVQPVSLTHHKSLGIQSNKAEHTAGAGGLLRPAASGRLR